MLSLHHMHYHATRLHGTKELLWSHSFRSVAENLISILVPVYLYNIGYSISEVMLYLLLQGVFWFLLIYPMLKFINAVGTKRAMAFSMLGNITTFILLATLPSHHWPLAVISLVSGWQTAVYWLAFRRSFARSLAHRRVGRYVSFWSALTTLSSGLAPAIGGAVATIFGITATYYLAVCLFVVAAVPLLRGEEFVRHERFALSVADVRRNLRDFFANFSESWHDNTQNYLWPLYIFLLLPSYAGVGILSSVMVLSSVIIALYVGRREEVKGERHYLREGTSVTGVVHVLQTLAQNAGQVFGINVLAGVGYALYLTPFNTKYYQRIDEGGWPYLMGMQMASALAYTASFGLLFVLSFVLPIKVLLIVGIAVAALFSFGIGRIR